MSINKPADKNLSPNDPAYLRRLIGDLERRINRLESALHKIITRKDAA